VDGPEIPEVLLPLIDRGFGGYLATADADHVPEATRVRGARVDPSRRRVTVFLPTAQSERTLENLRRNPRVAFLVGDVVSFQAAQIKGEAITVRPSTEEERALQERHMRAFVEAVAGIGGPAKYVQRHAFWPSHAVEIRVGEVFVQTPGPGSGRPWR
jgi:hypothetical protein